MAAISHTFCASKLLTFEQNLKQVLGAAGLIALCSQIQIILPFTIVPLTFQTLAVLLIGARLGSRKGAYTLLLYFAAILMGLPVLAGGASNPFVFLGPKGGYVLGFYFQAFVMGWFVEKMPWSQPMTLIVGGLIACMVQMGVGMAMLASYVGWNQVWAMGGWPFLPGEILKVLILTLSLTAKSLPLCGKRLNFQELMQ